MADFVHLHLHSQYSLLDGAILLEKLFPRLHELGMDAVALTDHGAMYGAIDFYEKARAAKIKPIIGVETYVTNYGRTDRNHRDNYHLVLLAENLEGYRNLSYIISKAHLEGFYYNARVDKQLLADYSQGLIALSGCLKGEPAQQLLAGQYDKARETAEQYASFFGKDSYFLELQQNGMPEQETVNAGLTRIAEETGLPLVATNDCHYLEPHGARAQEALICISTGKTLEDERRLKQSTNEFYLKSPEEMHRSFAQWPEALKNTLRIAERCNVELKLGKSYLPHYEVPRDSTLESYLRETAREGLRRRFEELGDDVDREAYQARLEEELDMIEQTGFPGYFLIVWDFIRHAKEQGIPVGPGRGSGAGSLVAYSLRITDIDPMPYGLLFERFLNPERVSMPDFDIDFCMNRRDEVIHYVTEKYGQDNVGGIVTFGSLKARGCVRDVGRVLGMPYGEVDKLAKLVPEGPAVTISSALKTEPRIREKMDEDLQVRELFEIATSLEGLTRQSGIHAAGIVIGDKPLWEYCPLSRQKDVVVTQYAKDEAEKVGLVKFDFLGLKTLTVIAETERLINRTRPEDDRFSVAKAPLDDAKVYQLISSGDTTGVFQLESSGFKELMQRLKPDRFEDIIAAVALYRPGPLQSGMVNDFVDRKHGRAQVEYPHPLLEDVLAETYGTIVYQEQVMQIARTMAGYTLGGADLLRKAMGKKITSVMKKQRTVFVEGAKEKGVDPRKADEIFGMLEKFAEYGFNKSHSAAYGLISYQTAYLKAHYPHEFLAGLLTCDMDNTDKVTRYMANARESGIEVKPPHVNYSEREFAVEENQIHFGMGAIKGVGGGAIEAIVEARAEGAFEDLYDFCERVDLQRANKKVLECLIKAGALDGLGPNRASLLAGLEGATEAGQARQREREWGQGNLFGGGGMPDAVKAQITEVEEWPEKLLLAYEREVLGFYFSGHPLEGVAEELRRYTTTDTSGLLRFPPRSTVRLGGMVEDLRERPAKSGLGRNAFFYLEDLKGRVEVLVFTKVNAEFGHLLHSNDPILVTGTLLVEGESDSPTPKIRADRIEPLDEARKGKVNGIEFVLPVEAARDELLIRLRDLIREYSGELKTYIRVQQPEGWEVLVALPEEFRAAASDELLANVDRLFGKRVAKLQFPV